MRILLMCSAGMSTSLLVSKMEKYAADIGRQDIIEATTVEDLPHKIADYDVFLLAPQVKYKEAWVKEIINKHGKQFANIALQDYGRVDGKKVLELAISLVN